MPSRRSRRGDTRSPGSGADQFPDGAPIRKMPRDVPSNRQAIRAVIHPPRERSHRVADSRRGRDNRNSRRRETGDGRANLADPRRARSQRRTDGRIRSRRMRSRRGRSARRDDALSQLRMEHRRRRRGSDRHSSSNGPHASTAIKETARCIPIRIDLSDNKGGRKGTGCFSAHQADLLSALRVKDIPA